MKLILPLALTVAPALAATISAPLTFTAIAEPTGLPGVFYGELRAVLTVAPNPSSPIPGIDAEVNYFYSFSDPDPTCIPNGNPGRLATGVCQEGLDFYSNNNQDLSGLSGIAWNETDFELSGIVWDGGANVTQNGSAAGIAYLPQGEYSTSLNVWVAYRDGLTPPNTPASLTMTIYTIFGSISAAPFETPEPATWVEIALALLCLSAKPKIVSRAR